MKECNSIKFLQWVLLRWPGLDDINNKIKVQSTKCLHMIGMSDLQAYKIYLDEHPEKWLISNNHYSASISRFYRDHSVFEYLEHNMFPELISNAHSGGNQHLSVWSAGCSKGEEPYSLSIVWNLLFSNNNKDLKCKILATDTLKSSIYFAQKGVYSSSSLSDLPIKYKEHCFNLIKGSWHIKDQYRNSVNFSQQDMKETIPFGPFDLILCRNVAFTYFNPGLQRQIIDKVRCALRPGGFLVIGNTESLPHSSPGWEQLDPTLPVYQNESS